MRCFKQTDTWLDSETTAQSDKKSWVVSLLEKGPQPALRPSTHGS